MRKIVFILSSGLIILMSAVIFVTAGCNESVKENVDINSETQTHSQISNRDAIPPLDIPSQLIAAGDTFSWRTFIAMNWPASINTCGPDTSNGTTILNGKGLVVWETYLTSEQVFVAPGKTPSPWCVIGDHNKSIEHLPKKVQDLARSSGVYRFIHRTTKAPHGLTESSGQPLVDQNGRFVRYEVRMNEDEYKYITQNDLWNLEGQAKYLKHDSINLPAGPVAPYGKFGAMEFKAAWKILGNGDDASRFYTITAIVFNDDSLDPSPAPNIVKLGLVGLHIAHKTASQNFWVWSTFEHVDNLTRSFYNPKCKGCPVNQPPSGGPDYKELDTNGKPLHKPTQVVRVLKVDTTNSNYTGDPFVAGINIYFQNLLKGSVWANYSLVSTQWTPNGQIFPNFLANTVQETYVQGLIPPTYGNFKGEDGKEYFQSNKYNPFATGITSSCMGCHYRATIIKNHRSDQSFLLGEAHK